MQVSHKQSHSSWFDKSRLCVPCLLLWLWAWSLCLCLFLLVSASACCAFATACIQAHLREQWLPLEPWLPVWQPCSWAFFLVLLCVHLDNSVVGLLKSFPILVSTPWERGNNCLLLIRLSSFLCGASCKAGRIRLGEVYSPWERGLVRNNFRSLRLSCVCLFHSSFLCLSVVAPLFFSFFCTVGWQWKWLLP